MLLADAAGNGVFHKNNDLADVVTKTSRHCRSGPVAVGYVGSALSSSYKPAMHGGRICARTNSLCHGRADAIATLLLATAEFLRSRREAADPSKEYVRWHHRGCRDLHDAGPKAVVEAFDNVRKAMSQASSEKQKEKLKALQTQAQAQKNIAALKTFATEALPLLSKRSGWVADADAGANCTTRL